MSDKYEYARANAAAWLTTITNAYLAATSNDADAIDRMIADGDILPFSEPAHYMPESSSGGPLARNHRDAWLAGFLDAMEAEDDEEPEPAAASFNEDGEG